MWIEDEDEFVDHQVLYGYSPFLIDNADRATQDMRQALTELCEPFDSVAAGWLASL